MIELNRFSKEIRQYQLNGALPQGDVKNALADIYEANYKPKWGVTKISRGCPSCISDMMKCLSAEFKMVEFKGVPELAPININEDACIGDINTMQTIGELKSLEFKGVPDKIVEVELLTLEQLKLEADRRGIKYHHKAGIKKLTELLND